MNKPDWWDERAVDDAILSGAADPPHPNEYNEEDRKADDDIWRMGGGFESADEIADGILAKVKESVERTHRAVVPIMCSSTDLWWLIEGYNRLRKRAEFADPNPPVYNGEDEEPF